MGRKVKKSSSSRRRKYESEDEADDLDDRDDDRDHEDDEDSETEDDYDDDEGDSDESDDSESSDESVPESSVLRKKGQIPKGPKGTEKAKAAKPSIVSGLFSSFWSASRQKTSNAEETAEDPIEDVNSMVSESEETYVRWMRRLINKATISSDKSTYKDHHECAAEICAIIKEIGGTARTKQLDRGSSIPKSEPKPPPAVFAEFAGAKKGKRPTLLVYANYDISAGHLFDRDYDEWTDDPFELVVEERAMRGRGAATKGYLVAWLAAIHAYLKVRETLPVRVKLVVEGMKEMNSEGLPTMLKQESEWGFLDDVDATVLCSNQWLDSEQPSLIKSLRGACHFEVEVKSSGTAVEAGLFRGTVGEPLVDLVKLLDSLTDVQGAIAVEGLVSKDQVSKKDRTALAELDFQVAKRVKELGLGSVDVRSRCARAPDFLAQKTLGTHLSIHSVRAVDVPVASSLTIPNQATARFSVHLSPSLKPDEYERIITRHLRRQMSAMQCTSELIIQCSSHPPFSTDPKNLAVQAGVRAIERVFDVSGDVVPDGGSSRIAAELSKHTSSDIVVQPLSLPEDKLYSPQEHIDREHFLDSVTYLACFMEELAGMFKEQGKIPKRSTAEYVNRQRSLSRLINASIWRK